MSTKRGLGPWQLPEDTSKKQLRLYNSLTRRKDLFVPQDGNKVTWYSCGPTVYDTSHLGHARSYVSFDILRRVLRDYFKYDVIYCMNITDIDDKIIKRARQTKLFTDFSQKDRPVEEFVSDIKNSMILYHEKLADEAEPAKQDMYKKFIKLGEASLEKMQSMTQDEFINTKEELLGNCREPLCEWLDKNLGAGITDNKIFFDLPKHYEGEFFSDMESLNVLPPDVLTRVTEFVPEIIEFVQTIITNGFAYEANGSVYFDTNKFSQDSEHYYAKLVPEAFGDSNALQDGEGVLTSDRANEKRSTNDFALWKLSKPGEPSWESPWGSGRPGWHIECSVMASKSLGPTMDIHTGGYDLKFPHHDNELAQSEAHYGHNNWVQYFLHTGHLTICGMKMSKSLKNFTSIKDALKVNTFTQIRFAFLLHSWKDTLDYSDKTMEVALYYEKLFKEFFLTVKNILRQLPNKGSDVFRKWEELETNLNDKYLTCKSTVHAALCDSVDTRTALESMKELISSSNIYFKEIQTSSRLCDYPLLKNIATYLTDMLKIFGAINIAGSDQIGFPTSTDSSSINREEMILPYLNCIANFREKIRQHAHNKADEEILRLCDLLRDEDLPNLGVRLEDVEGLPVIKLEDRETLLKELAEKKQQQEKEALEKEERRKLADQKQAERDEQKKINPKDMFKTDQKYKHYKLDENGIPTHDADGKELSKSARKKLQKLYDNQDKKYQTYLKEHKQ